MILGSPYNGRKAATYDAKRASKKKWIDENKYVDLYLAKHGKCTLLDVAVGTGRFLPIYQKHAHFDVTGVDVSDDMLRLAGRRVPGMKLRLFRGDATDLQFGDNSFDVVICIRLLHLLSEPVMRRVLREICRVASKCVVLTIQLGDAYRAGHDTATHDAAKFRSLVRRLGWRITTSARLTGAGWHIIYLEESK
jgi:ubiquinone/menaquinone biosynthesis C-methylase UbiE